MGLAAPFTQGSPSQFSEVWFPSNERTRATAMGFLGTYLGSAASYIMSPSIVPDPIGWPTDSDKQSKFLQDHPAAAEEVLKNFKTLILVEAAFGEQRASLELLQRNAMQSCVLHAASLNGISPLLCLTPPLSPRSLPTTTAWIPLVMAIVYLPDHARCDDAPDETSRAKDVDVKHAIEGAEVPAYIPPMASLTDHHLQHTDGTANDTDLWH